MKFKKLAKVLLSCLMAGALFTGCGGGDTSDKQFKLGMIAHLNATEQSMGKIIINSLNMRA